MRSRVKAETSAPSSGPKPPRRKRAAIVAGGAGFLGSHLCDRLIADGYRVYCIDNLYTGRLENLDGLAAEPRFTFIEQDVRAPLETLPEAQEVYNLACPASPPHYQRDPLDTVTTNVIGTLALLKLSGARQARLLQASTSEVYGDPAEHPQRGSYNGNVNPIGPRACYDEGKRVAETLCYDFRRQLQADVRVARIFNTYGPRMRTDDGRIISTFINQALCGEAMTIHGTGCQSRSFCYVSDLIEGLIRLMRLEDAPATPVNLGNPEEFTVLELTEEIQRQIGGCAGVRHLPPVEDDPQRRCPNIELAFDLLGWRPGIALRSGLRQTIDWFASPPGAVADAPSIAATAVGPA